MIRADKATPFKLLNDIIKIVPEAQLSQVRPQGHESAGGTLTCAVVAASRRAQTEVELNLASMLDMAFQLLAFFILTFHPSPIEGQLSLHLPPAVPVTNVQTERPDTAQSADAGGTIAKTLEISVFADGSGNVLKVQVGLRTAILGSADAANLHKLDKKLHEAFAFEGSPFEQIVIRVAPNLKYEELMKVIDVCTRQKTADGQMLHKISFVEMSGTEQAK